MVSVETVALNLRQVADFPKPGINFLDMSPVLADAEMFRSVIHHMAQPFVNKQITKIVAIESRGFVLGAAMAQYLNCGLVMVRKKGKLPGPTLSVSYALEYGTDQLEMLPQSLVPTDKVLIVDDVLATGGTAQATEQLCSLLNAEIVGMSFFIEIDFLTGRKKISVPVESLLHR